MVRTINVVYTTRKLSGSEARQLKMYMFLCSYDTVKAGDLIVSPMYTTPMQVIGVSNSSNRREIKDFMLGQALVRVVVNMFSGMTTGGFNPMMLALANNEDMDMKDLMMIQMMQGNGGSFNPMMLMMMDKGGDNSMLETMMMMGGQNHMMGFMNPASTEKK